MSAGHYLFCKSARKSISLVNWRQAISDATFNSSVGYGSARLVFWASNWRCLFGSVANRADNCWGSLPERRAPRFLAPSVARHKSYLSLARPRRPRPQRSRLRRPAAPIAAATWAATRAAQQKASHGSSCTTNQHRPPWSFAQQHRQATNPQAGPWIPLAARPGRHWRPDSRCLLA